MKRCHVAWAKYVIAALLSGATISGASLAPGLAHGALQASAPVSQWLQGWPMVGHDPQRTNRSPGAGPLRPHLLFTYRGPCNLPLIGPDGSIYSWCAQGLTALTATGQRRWIAPLWQAEGGPPVLSPSGLVLMNANSGRTMYRHQFIVALMGPTGRQRWRVDTLPWAAQLGSVPNSKGSVPLVTSANVLYMPFVGPSPQHGVEIFSPSGQPIRHVLPQVIPTSLVAAPDGTFYELGSDTLTAFSQRGTLLWQRQSYADTLLIGRHGTLYAAGGNRLAVYSPAGHLLWQRELSHEIRTIGERADGVVLAVGATDISAIDPAGRLLWRRAVGHVSTSVPFAPTLAIDARGRAYVGTADGIVRALAPDGSMLWTLSAGGPTSLGQAPSVALGSHGILAVTGTDSRLRVYR